MLASMNWSGLGNKVFIITLAAALLAGAPLVSAEDFDATMETVGRQPNSLVTPVNQRLTPAGTTLELPGLRPQALALSPDGRLLVTSGITPELVLVNPATGLVTGRIAFPTGNASSGRPVSPEILHPTAKPQLSFTGLTFSPDGTRIYLANVNGDIKVFAVGEHQAVTPLRSFALPLANAPDRAAEIPAGLAVSADGQKLYVALNLANHLAELDAASGQILRQWKVGVAPYGVALARGKAYVSNWGGRQPDTTSLTGPAGRGTLMRVDDRAIASEGSVSIIELTGTNQTELVTGRHTCELAVSPNGRYVVAANAGSDTLSVIDTRHDQLVETIRMRQAPGDEFGAQPNALAFAPSGHRLYVANGTQNALAVVAFAPGQSSLLGLIPTGWFPAAVAFADRQHQLCVASLKGLTRGRLGKDGAIEFNSVQNAGTLSFIPLPAQRQLAQYTRTALADLRYPLLAAARLPARPGQPARPVPERVGEPSVFQHVIYIIKENRTYDQVLGDVPAGNGSAGLCLFGARVTPNQHQFAREFVLLDNTYCSGALSADGHSWATSAIATDFMERSFAGWPRSYAAGNALIYSPAGFIWNDAAAHGRTVADFGEFIATHKHWHATGRSSEPTFQDCYQDFLHGTGAIEFTLEPEIEALRPFMAPTGIGWDLNVPDVVRADHFIQTLHQYGPGHPMPQLILLWLPNDHTSGTKPGVPTPTAQVADNDLAFGRVVEAVSQGDCWSNTCIFAVEDDPQDGWDHVSGYRTTAYVISPYTKRHTVVSTQYNQTSLLRTLELMLGLPPMNQMDATATPMFDCFTNAPDYTAYSALPNQIPLDELNPKPEKIANATLRQDAGVSARLPLQKEDQCPEDLFNHILWRAVKGPETPYPDWAVTASDAD